jgi:S1-C subfamily serine protease
MFQRCAIVVALVFFALRLSTAQDAIPPDTVLAVKKATVFVKVDWDIAKGTGTGFVVEVQKDAVLIATNYHVVAVPEYDKRPRLTPTELARSFKLTNVSVVFDSGTKTEVTSKAEVVAADIDNDLAILRVVGLKNKPTPIDYRSASTPVETMQVYMFGFPLGRSLSTTKGNPAVTVGKGSVSSIRTDEKGELAYVQIDGAINPGNSGGPVVDVKGQVVGVAVATYRDAQGIGLAVPGVDLVRLMKGRICGLHAVVGRTPTNKTSVKAEVEVSDPLGAVREVTLHYLVLPRGTKWPDDPIEKQTGAKKTTLKVAGAVAAGEIVLDSADGVVLVRAVPVGGAGAEGASPLRAVDLRGGILPGPGGRRSELGGATFPGWKEYTPKDRTYTVWIPEQPTSQSDQERSMSIRGQSVKFSSMNFQVPDGGPACRIEQGILEGSLADENPAELQNSIRDTIVRELKGRVISQENTLVGSAAAKEYRISTGTGVVRLRVLVAGNWVFMLHVVGSRSMVESPGAQIFLDSFNPSVGSTGGVASTIPAERRTKIQGGFNDPEFVDQAPEGGLLVGMEVATGKHESGNTMLFAARPLYRVGEREHPGQWHGLPDGKDRTRLVARPGYAVGAIKVKTSAGMDGLSLTFMKVGAGKLDLGDSYESPWTGSPDAASAIKLGGDGVPVVGLLGKEKESQISGMGLLFVDRESPGGYLPAGPGGPTPTAGQAPPSGADSKSTSEASKEKSGSFAKTLGWVAVGVVGVGAVAWVIFSTIKRSSAAGSAGHKRRRRSRDDDDDDEDDDEDDDDDDRSSRKRRGSRRR